jgi:hypothetical protein
MPIAAQTVTVPQVEGLAIIAFGLVIAGVILGIIIASVVRSCRKHGADKAAALKDSRNERGGW